MGGIIRGVKPGGYYLAIPWGLPFLQSIPDTVSFSRKIQKKSPAVPEERWERLSDYMRVVGCIGVGLSGIIDGGVGQGSL